MFTLKRIAFALVQKSSRKGLVLTHKNGCGGAISVMEQSCAVLISRVEGTYWIVGFVPYFGTV